MKLTAQEGKLPDQPAAAGLDLAAAMQAQLIELDAPEDCTSISVRGMSFEVPQNGVVKAPADVAQELLSHGFLPRKPKATAVKAARRAVVEE